MGTYVLDDMAKLDFQEMESALVAALPSLSSDFSLLDTQSLFSSLDSLERISRAIEMAQAAAAVALQDRHFPVGPNQSFNVEESMPGRSQFRNAAEFLQQRLRISKSSAKRRLLVGEALLPRISLCGSLLPAKYPELAKVAQLSEVGGEALVSAIRALGEAKLRADEDAMLAMESSLAECAGQHDPDFLRPVIQRWQTVIDQDGSAPTDQELKQRQGIWRMRSLRGLHYFQIWADQQQAEVLLTVMNAGTNPRAQTVAQRSLDDRSLPQKYLDTLTDALKAALRTDLLPLSGGARPQLLATASFKELLGEFKVSRGSRFGETGSTDSPTPTESPASARLTFTGPINAKNIRALACEADIIPMVFGSKGQVLDVGASNRLFNRTQRSALVARDKGCSFPDCTIPAAWCESHHVQWWSRNPWTAVENGALLCSHHHHLIHQDHWQIEMRDGVPWFIPPPWSDAQRRARRNLFHQI